MFLVCPKLAFDADPENVIEFNPSAPSAFEVLLTTLLASCAEAPAETSAMNKVAAMTVMISVPPICESGATPERGDYTHSPIVVVPGFRYCRCVRPDRGVRPQMRVLL